MQALSILKSKKITPEQLFMISVLAVNGGNYLYNLILGRVLGPAQFADAAVLITFLLVLSFVAMTFQLVTAKFSVLFEGDTFKSFVAKVYKQSFIVGIILGILIVVFSTQLQTIFNKVYKNLISIKLFWAKVYCWHLVFKGNVLVIYTSF